ncbi:hypothetical protein [Streptomyces sp. NBC_01500]|uniref:hypothetical protein n=1 Tax=Streptomyces sp. NBC_01500 TaxID=2903886 RepID=UPI0022519D42|nr:hypothetical protein [Streptomyces sp. NBC_01500]MCX4554119.1 hypothetical protein [Streptomyces sp. NBC_01500]
MTIKVGSKLESTNFPVQGNVVFGPYEGSESRWKVLVKLTTGGCSGQTVEWDMAEVEELPRFEADQVVHWDGAEAAVKAGPFEWAGFSKWVVEQDGDSYLVFEDELSAE